MDIDDLLSELRACVAAGQDAPYIRADELAALIGRIDELEDERSGMRATEWGVHWPNGDEFMEPGEAVARGVLDLCPGALLIARTAPGPWRVASA
jgi:hypothetical protein